jgi:aryl-alcohol dehydrogenase-like predicted oxidoreductase
MDYTNLGRTGLRVGVAGLGCGGSSRLGLGVGGDMAGAVKLVRRAIDLGVNFLDTANSYGTEEVLGRVLAEVPRDSVVISTKFSAHKGKRLIPAAEVVAGLHESLRIMGCDCIDLFQLHGVSINSYDHAMRELWPALVRERDKGNVRHIGITETAPKDHEQVVLGRALDDDCWDVMMLAINLMNHNACAELLPRAMENNIGTLAMFVVRSLFSSPERLRTGMVKLADDGKIDRELAMRDGPLDFLIHEGGAHSVIDAAYRFVRHQPGIDVVLFGTGNPDHLAGNIASILAPPLPAEDVRKLRDLFGHLKGVGLDFPTTYAPTV